MKNIKRFAIILSVVLFTNGLNAQQAVTVSSRIASSAGNAEENMLDNTVSLTSADLDFMRDGTDDHEAKVGLHFPGLGIPTGSTVQNAYIQFTADETHSGPITISLFGEASDNPSSWSTSAGNVSGRPKTISSATWSPPDWAILQEAGANQQTSDLSAIIQEIIDRPGYGSGDAINIIMAYNSPGKRVAESYTGSAAEAPILYVTYAGAGTGGGSGTAVWTLGANGADINYTSGNVGIGTSDPGTYKLAVNGNIHAREVKVDLIGWADYVFKESYGLPSLEEVEKHILEKGHLINIPSAKEVEANGIELGQMDRLLLEKIEELTLYILQLKKENTEQQLLIDGLFKNNH